jgi:cell fate regulator YaaT (PSP1 superfamily)
MAKIQDLPLNPMKISGVCGRLLCCLGYECEQYRAIKEKMPREGQHVMTEAGPAVVVGHNTLEEKVLVEYETGFLRINPANRDLSRVTGPRSRRRRQSQVQAEFRRRLRSKNRKKCLSLRLIV